MTVLAAEGSASGRTHQLSISRVMITSTATSVSTLVVCWIGTLHPVLQPHPRVHLAVHASGRAVRPRLWHRLAVPDQVVVQRAPAVPAELQVLRELLHLGVPVRNSQEPPHHDRERLLARKAGLALHGSPKHRTLQSQLPPRQELRVGLQARAAHPTA
jgi:hypothetical protein